MQDGRPAGETRLIQKIHKFKNEKKKKKKKKKVRGEVAKGGGGGGGEASSASNVVLQGQGGLVSIHHDSLR